MSRSRPLVLCYHAVSGTWEHQLAVHPTAFEAQVTRLLRAGCKSVPADQLAAGAGRVFHVTFDDAFQSVSRVLPTIERLELHASVFAVTELAETGGPFDRGNLDGDLVRFPDEVVTMNWDALRELRARGIEVGSHTVTHPRLSSLSDAELREELVASRDRLGDELGASCQWLAYPFGDEDQRVRVAARQAGYAGAFALPGRLAPADPFGIPRVGVWRKDVPSRFHLKTSAVGRRLTHLRA